MPNWLHALVICSFALLSTQSIAREFPPKPLITPWGTEVHPYMYGAAPADPNSPTKHDHAAGHDVYSGWINLKDEMCCNGKDCEPLTDAQETTVNGVTYIFVGFGKEKKEWCPVVEAHHSLQQPARSPDYTKSHACVLPPSGYGASVCQRLRCYMGRPQT